MKTELNLLMACCMVLSACGALKSKKSLHTQELQSSSHNEENTNQQGWATRNTLLLDTSNSEYVVQITPLGKFFYNAEKGFEGMAEKVVVSGKANKGRIMNQQQQTGHQLQHQKSSSDSTDLKIKVQQVAKSKKPKLSAIIVPVLVISLGLAVFIRRKWRLI